MNKCCRNFSISEIGPEFACTSRTSALMDKWMLQADSAHQIGPGTSLQSILIVVESGGTGEELPPLCTSTLYLDSATRLYTPTPYLDSVTRPCNSTLQLDSKPRLCNSTLYLRASATQLYTSTMYIDSLQLFNSSASLHTPILEPPFVRCMSNR